MSPPEGVVGYSLVLTDVYTQAILRIDVQPFDVLLIANPDPEGAPGSDASFAPPSRVVELEDVEALGGLLI